MANKSDLLQGTLDLLILKTLEPASMHGWGISLRIQAVSQGSPAGEPGLAVPRSASARTAGPHRIAWGASENNRQAKYYELTRSRAESSSPRRPRTGSVSSEAVARISAS